MKNFDEKYFSKDGFFQYLLITNSFNNDINTRAQFPKFRR